MHLFRTQAWVLYLFSLNRTGKMAASEEVLENFKPADPLWRSSSRVPSTRQDMDLLERDQQRVTEVIKDLESQACKERLKDTGYSAWRRLGEEVFSTCTNTWRREYRRQSQALLSDAWDRISWNSGQTSPEALSHLSHSAMLQGSCSPMCPRSLWLSWLVKANIPAQAFLPNTRN